MTATKPEMNLFRATPTHELPGHKNRPATFASVKNQSKPRTNYDPLLHCGVFTPIIPTDPESTKINCKRALNCKLHSSVQKRAVNRPIPFEQLWKNYKDKKKKDKRTKISAMSPNLDDRENSKLSNFTFFKKKFTFL